MVSTLTMCHHANGRQHCHDGISTIRHYHCHDINIIIIVASSRQHYHHDIFTVQPSCYHYYNDSTTITIMSSLSSLSSSSWQQHYHVITIIILTIMPALSSHWVLVERVAAYAQPVASILLLLVVTCCIAIHVCPCSYRYVHPYLGLPVKIHIMSKRCLSREPESNQWPMDDWAGRGLRLHYSPPLYQLSYREIGVSNTLDEDRTHDLGFIRPTL